MRLLKNKWFWISLPFLSIALLLAFSDMAYRYVVHGLPTGAAIGAKLACSGVYVTGRSPADVIKDDLNPFNPPILEFASYEFDQTQKTASATLLGLVTRTALYRDGVGCTVMIDKDREQLLAQSKNLTAMTMTDRPSRWPAGDQVVIDQNIPGVNFSALTTAVENAFEDHTKNKTVDTRAIIVVQNGHILAEKYAAGFDENSRFLSWSAAKSVISALIGTLVKEGTLALNAPAPVAEWDDKNDPRHSITLDHLLTMRSGLDFSEPYIPNNDSTNMLFRTSRMGDFAAGKGQKHAPGSQWYYSSGTTNLLSRILFEQAGSSLEAVTRQARARLFEPLGMTSTIFEPDESGSFVGSSYLYATARDWARFGLLYLNEGRVGDRQILSREWVTYSRTPIPQAPQGQYGAQFWLNTGPSSRPQDRLWPDAPQDMYMANGHNGQHIAVIPSQNAVIVRLGWSTGGTRFDLNRHFTAILKALPATSEEQE